MRQKLRTSTLGFALIALACAAPFGCGSVFVEERDAERTGQSPDALCTVERDVLLSTHPICNSSGSLQLGDDGTLHAVWSTTHQSASPTAGGVHLGHYAVGSRDVWEVREDVYGDPIFGVSLGGAPEYFAVVGSLDGSVDYVPTLVRGLDGGDERLLETAIDREGSYVAAPSGHGLVSNAQGATFFLTRVGPAGGDEATELALVELSDGGAQIRRQDWEVDAEPVDVAIRRDGSPVWLSKRGRTAVLYQDVGEPIVLDGAESPVVSPRALATDSEDRVYVLLSDEDGRGVVLVRAPDGSMRQRLLPEDAARQCPDSPSVGDRCTTRATRMPSWCRASVRCSSQGAWTGTVCPYGRVRQSRTKPAGGAARSPFESSSWSAT